MRFNFTPDQDEFRSEVSAFLSETLTPAFWDYHVAEELPEWSPRFSRAAAERGLLGIAWPEPYGGRNKGLVEQAIYMEEMAYAGAPQEQHRRAIQQVGPSIMAFGTEEQKARFLPGVSRGEISFAMGLSEPNAGSDLAGVEARAVRDGDEFVLNGEKKYTSGAHYSDYLWTVVRTDPQAPKHRGISMIVVPLHSPGVDVQPLIDPLGRHHFNKIFFTDVRIPVDNLVGEQNRGWYINAFTMDLERSGGAHIGNLRRMLDAAVRSFREAGVTSGAARMRLADLAITVNVARLLSYRVAWLRSTGASPNYEVSIIKLLASETTQQIAALVVNALGPAALVVRDGPWDSGWGSRHVAAIPATAGQGTSEIMRNIIATRGLGLPRG